MTGTCSPVMRPELVTSPDMNALEGGMHLQTEGGETMSKLTATQLVWLYKLVWEYKPDNEDDYAMKWTIIDSIRTELEEQGVSTK